MYEAIPRKAADACPACVNTLTAPAVEVCDFVAFFRTISDVPILTAPAAKKRKRRCFSFGMQTSHSKGGNMVKISLNGVFLLLI